MLVLVLVLAKAKAKAPVGPLTLVRVRELELGQVRLQVQEPEMPSTGVPQALRGRGPSAGQAARPARICLHSTLRQAAIPASLRAGRVLVLAMQASPLPLRHAAAMAVLAAGWGPQRVLAPGQLPVLVREFVRVLALVLVRILDFARARKQAALHFAPGLGLGLGLKTALAQPSAPGG